MASNSQRKQRNSKKGGGLSAPSDFLYKECKNIAQDSAFIKSVQKVPFFNDEPQAFTYIATFENPKIPSDITGGGTSLDEKTAYIKAVMEAVERYALIPSGKNYHSVWKQLSPKEIESSSAISFNTIVKFSKEQLSQKEFKNFILNGEKDKLYCCKVFDLIQEKEIFFPSQFFYLPYWEREPILRLPISTGAASGTSREDCIYKGILEIFERDQFINSYLAKIPGKRVDIKNPTKEMQELLNEFSYYNLVPHIIYLNSDIEIPTILTILQDPTEIGPLYTLGMKCSPNISYAIKGSLEEAFHSRRWLRYIKEQKTDKYISNLLNRADKITEISDRGLLWSSKYAKGKLDFWIKTPEHIAIDLKRVKNQKSNLKELLKIVKQLNWHCYAKDFSTKSLIERDIFVYKVFIPEAHPLYLDERFPCFDQTRIKQILHTKKKIPINKFLQPFL